MRLEHIHFENWGILRDLQFEFATSVEHPMTVVRANSATGKTLMLEGLTWGLFGKKALNRKNYLGPSYLKIGDTQRVAVTIEFTHDELVGPRGNQVPVTRRYRARRSVLEERTSENDFVQGVEEFAVWEVTEAGTAPTANPDVLIRQVFPEDQKGIFITDGDAVLQFLVSDGQNYVKDAIESVLSIRMVTSALSHAKEAVTKITKQASEGSQDAGLNAKQAARELVQTQLAKDEERLREVQDQLLSLADQARTAQKKLDDALAGGYEALQEQLTSRKAEHAQLVALLKEAGERHARLLAEPELSHAVFGPVLSAAYSKLDDLHVKGDIPKNVLPILNELLQAPQCFCGETLLGAQGAVRLDNIRNLITAQQDQDELRLELTALYYGVIGDMEMSSHMAEQWRDEFKRACGERIRLQTAVREAGIGVRELDRRIAAVGATEVPHLQQTKEAIDAQMHAANREQGGLEQSISQNQQHLSDLDTEIRRLLRASKEHKLAAARLEAGRDVVHVLEETLKTLREDELNAVSRAMNDYFLAITRASGASGLVTPGAGAISGASITSSYEIQIHTTAGANLNATSQLNGGHRRALVFAFIWALADISKRTIPRVIDTPLGMMDPNLKKRAVEFMMGGRTRDLQPPQVVLLLTPSEIRDVEDELNNAGRFYTLVPTSRLPDRAAEPNQTLACSCKHTESCAQCAPEMASTLRR